MNYSPEREFCRAADLVKNDRLVNEVFQEILEDMIYQATVKLTTTEQMLTFMKDTIDKSDITLTWFEANMIEALFTSLKRGIGHFLDLKTSYKVHVENRDFNEKLGISAVSWAFLNYKRMVRESAAARNELYRRYGVTNICTFPDIPRYARKKLLQKLEQG